MPTPIPEPTRASRMHVGGKLAFRGRKRLGSPEGLPLVIGGEDPPPLAGLVPLGCRDVDIEVGAGKGTFVLAASAASPDAFLIGIEAAPAYAQLAADRLHRAGRSNALLLVDNAKLYLRDRVPERSVRHLHVYYPDPWPKRRHRKRRFFSSEMPEVLARILRADGWLLVATDNACYAGQICLLLGASGLLLRDEQQERLLQEMPAGHAFTPTSFERKYAQEGRVLRRYAWRPLVGPAARPQPLPLAESGSVP